MCLCLFLFIYLEMRSHFVAQTALKNRGSSNRPASASQVAVTTDVRHRA